MDKLGASKVSSDMSTLANSNANFAPCDTLVSMAESGAKFYQTQPVADEPSPAPVAEQAIEAEPADEQPQEESVDSPKQDS